MKSLILPLLAALCCLVSSHVARADVSTVTDISYYAPTNSIRITATTYFNYDTWCYYDVYHWGQVYKDDQPLGEMFLSYQYDGIDAYNELFFPYDPTAEYTVDVYPVLNARYRHPIGDTYEDYYNYVQWSYGLPVYHPYYYGFTGPGPDVQIDGSTILLGTVFGFFTEGAPAGPPDHVKVISDSGQTKHVEACGFPIRLLDYQAVDAAGRRVSRGKISTRERFYDADPPNWEIGGMWSTCTPSWVSPGGCTLGDLGAKWPDTIYAGNDSNCSTPCGAQPFIQKWIWCPRGQPEKVLASIVLDINSQRILLNGSSQFTPGVHLH